MMTSILSVPMQPRQLKDFPIRDKICSLPVLNATAPENLEGCQRRERQEAELDGLVPFSQILKLLPLLVNPFLTAFHQELRAFFVAVEQQAEVGLIVAVLGDGDRGGRIDLQGNLSLFAQLQIVAIQRLYAGVFISIPWR